MNNETRIYEGLSTLIRVNVLEPIVQYVQSRQQQGPITVDELANLLRLPANSAPVQTNSAPASMPSGIGFPAMPAMPPSLVGFGMPMPMGTAAGGKKGGRSKTPTEVPPDEERCEYVFTRGQQKHSRCTSRCEPGIPYCRQCKTKGSAKTRLQQIGGAPASIGNMSMPPALPGLPNMFGNSMMNAAPQAPKAPSLQAIQLGPGIFRETTKNLYLKQGGKVNEYICCGYFPDPNNTNNYQPLTPELLEYCKQHDFSYVDPNKADVPMNQPSPPQANMPQGLPTFSQSQGLPTFSQSQGLPTFSQSQGLPTFSQSQGLPTFSQSQGLPQVPSFGSGMGMSMTEISNPDDPTDDDDYDDDE